MALKYTGRADVLHINGKSYAKKELYEKDSDKYDGSLDKTIPGMTRASALHLIENSSIHSFEEDGKDLLDMTTRG
jgi:hypothetical protein